MYVSRELLVIAIVERLVRLLLRFHESEGAHSAEKRSQSEVLRTAYQTSRDLLAGHEPTSRGSPFAGNRRDGSNRSR